MIPKHKIIWGHTLQIAQYSLGICYEEGKGTPQKWEKALELFKKAAEQEHIRAKLKAAEFYELGKGVYKDKRLASFYYSSALNRPDIGIQKSGIISSSIVIIISCITLFLLSLWTPELTILKIGVSFSKLL